MIEPKKELKKHKITNEEEVGTFDVGFDVTPTFIWTCTNPNRVEVVPTPKKEKWYKKFFKNLYLIPKNIFQTLFEEYPLFLITFLSATISTLIINLISTDLNGISILTFFTSYVVFLIERGLKRW